MPVDPSIAPLRCPECGQRLSWADVPLSGAFQCPACLQSISVPKMYTRSIHWASNILAVLLPYLLGMRDGGLVLAYLLGVFPLKFLLLYAVTRTIPPTLQLDSDQAFKLGGPPRDIG